MPSKMSFPEIHNEGRSTIENGFVTFTYLDSKLNSVTETKPVLTTREVVEMTKARLARFKSAPLGARESDYSRTERKYIAAHESTGVLRAAWEMMDEHTKMEFVMALDKRSHHGISDPAWTRRNEAKVPDVIGDDKRVL